MSWRETTIGELVTLQRGHDLTDAQRMPGDIPVIGSAGQNGTHNLARQKGPGFTIGRSGGSIGKVTYVPTDYWPHNTCLYAKDLKGNNARFLAYLLSTRNLAKLNSGAAQPSLNRNFVHAQKVLAPDLPTQKRIAEILSAYDDLIENNRRRIAQLEKSARLLYREWFVHFRFPGYETTKFIDGLPEGWCSRTIDDVCQTMGGGTPSTKIPAYWADGDVTWVTPTDITRNDCLALLDSEKKISREGLAKSSAKLVPPYTILMTSRASVGFFGLAEKIVCTNQGFINIIPDDERMRYYLLFNLLSRVAEIRGHAGGATYAEISKGKFRALLVVQPESKVLDAFHNQVKPLMDQVRLLKKSMNQLAKARDLLLPRLMDGRIPVNA